MKMIFFATSMTVVPVSKAEGSFRRKGNSRCWGWYPTLKRAKDAVEHNEGDMAEGGTFNYTVIEKCPEGTLGVCSMNNLEESQVQWYLWKRKPRTTYEGKWIPIQQPKWARGVIGYWN